MYSKVSSAALYGMNAEGIVVEADISGGLPALIIVGLPDASVRESKDRIKSAIVNSGCRFPQGRIIVNLVPANTKKEGNHFDLPMAVGILTASGILPQERVIKYSFIGELSLDGRVNSVAGVLPLIIGLCEVGAKRIFLPEGNISEASVVKGAELYPVKSLSDVVRHLTGKAETHPYIIERKAENNEGKRNENRLNMSYPDFADVRGQEQTKRALVIAASAMHNVLMSGPPGVGKSMLAKCMPGILPPMTYDERLELTKIYSIAGMLKNEGKLMSERPFRAPHHTISDIALIGGGKRPRPGEISLSHFGVLFLDEMPEFGRHVLEVLRQPMEDEFIEIARSGGRVRFPAKFLLIAAMNPCPCGYFGDESGKCTCTASQIQKYNSRLSGPIMDRIDIYADVSSINFEQAGFRVSDNSKNMLSSSESDCSCNILADKKEISVNDISKKQNRMPPHLLSGKTMTDISSTLNGRTQSTAEMRKLVLTARDTQLNRYADEKITYNSQLTPDLIQRYCSMDMRTTEFLNQAYVNLKLSVRACHRIVKLARTIADIEGERNIGFNHVAEAVRYRNSRVGSGEL